MKAIETNIFVKAPGRAVVDLRLPPEIKQGRYRAMVIIEEYPVSKKRTKKGVRFPVFDAEPVNPNNTFRREDLYGDDGR
ncbi:MAG: hypothetical protein D3906_16970 [Candidatus Electrothrix sp. AUS1_2]|nr:hypothetical protein [Candidatus Electrothrix sp. AUS1_2]